MTDLELQREWYAADKQDIYLRDHLFEGKKNGFYVDIGSADGLYKSNTFLLERDLGWNGICIEARTEAFEKCSLRRKAKCFNFVMGNGDQVTFRQNGTGSTITEVGSGDVQSQTLETILSIADAPKSIDLLSMDIEGAEELVLRDFPFDEYDIKVICVELPPESLVNKLTDLGYTRHRTINNWPDNTGYAFSDNNDWLFVKN